MALTREDIRQGGIEQKLVPVEEWGGDVRIRAITVRDRLEFGQRYGDEESAEEADYPADIWLVLKSVVSEDGNRLFADSDVEWLLDTSNTAIQKIANACMELNGLTPEAAEAAEGN